MKNLGNVLILGDSYSTFKGYIPAEYEAYYNNEDLWETGVNRVDLTWWHQLIESTDASLIRNDSWSGTTICNTGYAGQDMPNSFIRRFDRLAEEGFFASQQIDTVLVMGGQNDDWSQSPIGELNTKNWTDEDLSQYGPALCYLMHRLKTVLPNARILFVINSEMRGVIMDYQVQAAKIFGVACVQLNGIHKVQGHPTEQGMKQIANQILTALTP